MIVYATQNRRLRTGRRTHIDLVRGETVDVAQLVEAIGQVEVDSLIAEGALSTRRPTIGRRFPRTNTSVRTGTDQSARP